MIPMSIVRMVILQRAQRWGSVLLAGAVLLLAGCSGSSRIQFSSLSFRTIDPPNATVAELATRECYWWPDETGRVWVVMQRSFAPPFHPELRVHLELSLVVDCLPRGKARNYRLDRESLRARIRIGPWETRFTSQIGIAAVYRERGDRLRGSVRLQAQRVTSQLLGGWGRPSRYLMLVEFTAVPNDVRGGPIVASTESAGWERQLPDATDTEGAADTGDEGAHSTNADANAGAAPDVPESDK